MVRKRNVKLEFAENVQKISGCNFESRDQGITILMWPANAKWNFQKI